MTHQGGRTALHYGWAIVAVGALSLFACFGLARYAYAMLLPGMQAGLGLPYDRMGLIGTANFTGYLAAVLLSPLALRRLPARPLIASALALLGLAMLGMSFGQGFASIAALYTLVGLGGGFTNIPVMTLVTRWFASEQRGTAAGLVIAGNGVGIMAAGFLVPALNRLGGADGWRYGWFTLGCIALAAAACAGIFLRNDPAELGLSPVGKAAPKCPPQGCPLPADRPGSARLLPRLGVLYLAFGLTFMVYGTFIVTTMVREYGLSDAQAGLYWSWVGILSLFSGAGFGALSDRIGRRWGFALVFAVQTAAYLLAGLKLGTGGLAASIVLYGLAVFAVPAVMTAAVGDYLGLNRAASGFAAVTVFFAVGQTLGPAGAGLVADATGGFAAAYLAAAAVTACAAALALTLPRPGHG